MANIHSAIGLLLSAGYSAYSLNTGSLNPSSGFLVVLPTAYQERLVSGSKSSLAQLHKAIMDYVGKHGHHFAQDDTNFLVMEKDGEDIILSVQAHYLTEMDAIYYCQHSDNKYRDLVFGKNTFLHTRTQAGSIPKGVGF